MFSIKFLVELIGIVLDYSYHFKDTWM